MRRLRRLAHPLPALLLITAAGLVARLWALGWRVMHQDEARVADWILHYMDVGAWEYYAMIHGPFLPHVNSVVFQVLPPNDFSARLVVALIGAALPLSAWLFRKHLRDSEVVALGLLLALNPLLLYYSRFMRNDLPVAAFMLVAVGLFVRAHDTRDTRYLYAGTLSMALGFTAKELALLYPFYWLGAAALLLDHRLSASAAEGERLTADLPPWLSRAVAWAFDRYDRLRARYAALRGGPVSDRPLVADPGLLGAAALAAASLAVTALVTLPSTYNVAVAPVLVLAVLVFAYAPYGPQFVLAGVEFFAVFVFFYAPRAADLDEVGLFNVLHDPAMLPEVVEAATYGVYVEFLDRWSASASGHAYVNYLDTFWNDIESGALVLFVLAIAGFLIDRYRDGGPRDVVALTAYWGFASFVTYPVIAENPFPWEMVHVVAPLAVPAAVALGWIARQGAAGVAHDDAVRTGAAVVLVFLLVGQMGVTAYDTSFERSQSPDVEIVQCAQPPDRMQDTLSEVYRLSDRTPGTDVLYYGDAADHDGGLDDSNLFYDVRGEWDGLSLPPAGWFSRLPLPWYFNSHGVTVNGTSNESLVTSGAVPVVVSSGESSHRVAEELRAAGYRQVTYARHACFDVNYVFFVRA
ncbi:MAG: flippase activity-associated protein Agl23 [Halobacteriaceae archaeon]